MLTLDEIKRYYRVKKFTFNVNRKGKPVAQTVHCVPNALHERYSFAPFDRLKLKTGQGTLITYENEFLILEDTAAGLLAIAINVPPLTAKDHGIEKLENDGFVHPALIPAIKIFDVRKPFFGYEGFKYFSSEWLPYERTLGDLLNPSNILDIHHYRASLEAAILMYASAAEKTQDWPARTIFRFRQLQLRTKLRELDSSPLIEADVQQQDQLEAEVIKLFLQYIDPLEFFAYIHLKATLSVAEIKMMETKLDALDDDLKRRLGNETSNGKLRESIFSRLYTFGGQTTNLTYLDFLLREQQFVLAYDWLERQNDKPKTDEGQKFVDFYAALENLQCRRYPQKFYSYQWLSALPESPSDLDIFSHAEYLFFNVLDNNLAQGYLTRAEALYKQVSNSNRVLFLLARIRLLHIRTLTRPMSDEVLHLQRYKAELLKELSKLASPAAFDELLRIYRRKETSPEVRSKILDTFWGNIEKLGSLKEEVIELLLDRKYTPTEDIADFTTRCLHVTETLAPQVQSRLKQKLLQNYSSNRVSVAHQFYVEKNWDEALRWANFIMQANEDSSTDSLTAAALEPYALISEDVSTENDLIRNRLRYYLFRHAVASDDVETADYYYKGIDNKILDTGSLPGFMTLESDFKNLKYRHLYTLAKDLESELKRWLTIRSFEYFELFLQFQQLFAKFELPTTDNCGVQLEEFEYALKGIIGSRWKNIQNTRNSYIYDNMTGLNQKFAVLASAIDRDRRYHILMPTLRDDDHNIAIKDLEFGQFILTPDKKQFIHLGNLISNMVLRINNGECNRPVFPYPLAYYNHITEVMDVTEELLTEDEVKALSLLVPQAPSFLTLAKNRLAAKKMTALGAFQELRAALSRGDISDGKYHFDDNAGADSMTAVGNFKCWFEALQPDQRLIIEQLPRFNEIKTRLFKSLEKVVAEAEREKTGVRSLNQNTNDCINLIGDIVDSFINTNRERLNAITSGTGFVADAEWEAECHRFISSVGSPRILPPPPDLPPTKDSRENPTLSTAFTMAIFLRKAINRNDSPDVYRQIDGDLQSLLANYAVMECFKFRHNLMQLKTRLMATRVTGMPARKQYYERKCSSSDKNIFLSIVQHKAFRKNNNDIFHSLLNDNEGSTYYSLKDGVVHCHIAVGSRENRTTLDCEIFVDYTRPKTPVYIMVDEKTPIYFSNLDQAATEYKLNLMLNKSSLAPTFNSFQKTINSPENAFELKSRLLDLRTALVNEAYSGKATAEDNVEKVVSGMNTMIVGMHQTKDSAIKSLYYENCKKELTSVTAFDSPLGKAIRPVLTMVAAIVIGVVIGALIGVALGAFTGPGAVATGLAGAIKGGLLGAKAGVGVGAGYEIYNTLSFWGKPKIEQSVIAACEAAKESSHIAVSA